jgi:hypothetical protein
MLAKDDDVTRKRASYLGRPPALTLALLLQAHHTYQEDGILPTYKLY